MSIPSLLRGKNMCMYICMYIALLGLILQSFVFKHLGLFSPAIVCLIPLSFLIHFQPVFLFDGCNSANLNKINI